VQKLAESLGPFYTCQFLIADADLWVDENKYDKAEANYRAALALARRYLLPRLEAAALANWGRLATKQNYFDESLDLSGAALRLARSLDLKGNIATILGNLGWSYAELGDFEASREFYKQGAEESAKHGMSGYSDYWFSGLANSYIALREYAQAEDLARDTLKQAQELKDAETTALCLNVLADTMLRTNRLGEAERYSQEALTIEATGRDKLNTLDTLALAAKIATAKGHFSEAEGLFKRVVADPSVESQLRWEVEAGLARVRGGQGKFAEAERQYLKAIEIIEKARHSIHHDELRLSFLSSGISVYGEYIDFLIRRGRPTGALAQGELSRARTLQEGLDTSAEAARGSVLNFRPERLAQRLEATLLFYWLGEKHSYLWVVTPANTTHITLPAAGEIDPVNPIVTRCSARAIHYRAGKQMDENSTKCSSSPRKNLFRKARE
jgi:tetratricopeptide (TPR) repeat protein